LKSKKIELNTFNSVARLKRKALSCPEAKETVGAIVDLNLGPIKVQFVKIADVLSVPLVTVPPALLSDSKPSEVEIEGLSAIAGSLTPKPN